MSCTISRVRSCLVTCQDRRRDRKHFVSTVTRTTLYVTKKNWRECVRGVCDRSYHSLENINRAFSLFLGLRHTPTRHRHDTGTRRRGSTSMFSRPAPDRQMKRRSGSLSNRSASTRMRLRRTMPAASGCWRTPSRGWASVASMQAMPASLNRRARMGWTVSRKRTFMVAEPSGGHEHANAEVDDEADDVVGRGDEGAGGEGWVNLEPVQRERDEGAE